MHNGFVRSVVELTPTEAHIHEITAVLYRTVQGFENIEIGGALRTFAENTVTAQGHGRCQPPDSSRRRSARGDDPGDMCAVPFSVVTKIRGILPPHPLEPPVHLPLSLP